MLSSASLSENGPFLYEPAHGSYRILPVKTLPIRLQQCHQQQMMLRISFGLEKEAAVIEHAINEVLDAGYRTGDLMAEGKRLVSTTEMTNEVKSVILDDEAIAKITDAYSIS